MPEIKMGDRIWCILPSSESMNYGDDMPRPPWLAQVLNPPLDDRFYAGTVSEDGSVDCDSNASTFGVMGKDAFLTEQEAEQAFEQKMEAWLDRESTQLLRNYNWYLERLKTVAAKVAHI